MHHTITEETVGFKAPVVITKVKNASTFGRARWRVINTFGFYSAVLKRLIVIEAGYETDLSSVPRVPFAYWITGDVTHTAAVVHDKLCDEHNTDCSVSWKVAADVFKEAMICEGVSAWRRNMMYWAVRLRGGNKKCNKQSNQVWENV